MQLQSDSCPMEPMAAAMIYRLYICIATVGNTIQTVNSPMYDTYMSTPGNTAKLGTAHTATYRQHKEAHPWLEANLQCISLHTTESALGNVLV